MPDSIYTSESASMLALLGTTGTGPVASRRIRSWFDVAEHLNRKIVDVFPPPLEEQLTSFYFGSNKDDGENENPNLETLTALAKNVSAVVIAHWSLRNPEEASTAISSIQELLNGLNLRPWGDQRQNAITPYFAVLKGIDIACQNNRDLLNLGKSGPMNDGRADDGIGVYLKPKSSYIDRLMAQSGTERIFENKINDQFKRLAFFNNPYPVNTELPRIVNVIPPKSASMPSEKNPLRIGMAAFSGKEVIDAKGPDSPAETTPAGGATFRIEYSPGYDSRYADGVAKAVDDALSNKCHILVFPELMITPGLRQVIKAKLSKATAPSLFLIVAGSAWENDNNVCHLLDGFGNDIGVYYKYSRFETGASYSRPDRRLLVEGLATPGKRCTLVNVQGFGLVLPSICKDLVSEDERTVQLARAFRPILVCCPAYSGSIDHAFEQPTGSIVERSLAMVCISNCCGARKLRDGGEEEERFSAIAAPGYKVYADGSNSETHQARIEKKEAWKTRACLASCQNNGSCLFVAQIDYRAVLGVESVLPDITVTKIIDNDN